MLSCGIKPGDIPLHPGDCEAGDGIQRSADRAARPPDKGVLAEGKRSKNCAYAHEAALEAKPGEPCASERI
jgi:hypothetical protein